MIYFVLGYIHVRFDWNITVNTFLFIIITKLLFYGFKFKVGEGVYGSVYQGTLPNVNSAAVKLLNELKDNG